jgi:ferredoxin-NADP reductase
MRFRNTWHEAEVIHVSEVAENAFQIQIAPSSGALSYTHGAHIDVSIVVKDTPEIRSYSLVGQPNKDCYTICVKKLENSKGGSLYMSKLRAGDKIRISQPTNHFELAFNSKEYLLIAGGIGITPLVGMAEVLSKRADTKVRMIYLGKAKNEMPYVERLSSLLGDALIVNESESAGLYDLSKVFDLATEKTQVYLCGPMGLMNAIRKLWEASTMPTSHLRFETFGASGLFAPQTFSVKIPRFDKEVLVPENESLLSVLENEGIEVMYDCKRGECGLCQVDILEHSGDIDHRDFFFSEEEKGENKKLCACVSRIANGSAVIDTAYRG